MNGELRVVVVDDEPLARETIALELGAFPAAKVVSSCRNGSEALAAITELQPDLVFLDIRMPGMSGFDVLARLDQDSMPVVIFVTAYDDHAIRAFEMHALDYLLKPFDADRFRVAYQRAAALIQDRAASALGRQISALLETHRDGDGPGGWITRLVVQSGSTTKILRSEEIVWLEAANIYVNVHTRQAAYLKRASLTQMVSRLDPNLFMRVHRSSVVNLEAVEEIEHLEHGGLRIAMRGGARLRVSRSYRRAFLQWLDRRT